MYFLHNSQMRAQEVSFGDQIEIFYFSSIEDGKRQVPKLVETKIVEPEIGIQPVFTISKKQAQQFMDDLYRCGIRPTESIGTQGEKDAMKDHLKSMKEVYEKQAGTNQQLLDYVIGKKAQ